MNTKALGWIALVAVILLAQALQLGDALEYQRSLVAREPWRLLTAHLVHLSWRHALVNCIALMLLIRIVQPWMRQRSQWLTLAATGAAISLVFLVAMPELDWYRGLSGALHGLYFAGVVAWISGTRGRARWLPLLLMTAGIAKVLLEQPWDAALFPYLAWLEAAVVPQAHLIGALVGTALGVGLAARAQPPQAAQ